MSYKVLLFRRIEGINEWYDSKISKEFDGYEKARYYFKKLIEDNLYSSSYVILQLYQDNVCIGCWDSKEYKNANKTKTSNL